MRERVTLGLRAGFVLGLGIFPAPLLSMMRPSLEALLNHVQSVIV
jgi:NADH:ubiquinone oxidoreductase subunit 4 (subunit M)